MQQRTLVFKQPIVRDPTCSKQPVKFDPTVDRLILRQQTEAIKKLGYRFLATEQTWYPV